MDFEKGQTTVVSHSDRFFAIGLSIGHISLYDPASIQVLRHMTHPERVNILEFSSDDLLLASCGSKHFVLWDPESGVMTHSFPLGSPVLPIMFLGMEEVLGAFQACELTKWYV